MAQLSGFSVAYGKSYQQPLHTGGEYIKSNPFSVEYSQYLHRFWSAAAQFQYETGGFYDQQHLSNPFQIVRVGGNINYWILNDIRLLGKMARSSCKGKLVALVYKFRLYLSGGLYGNWLRSPANNIQKTYGSYSFGLGMNMYQFAISKYPMRSNSSTKYLIIPFVTANYIGGFKPVSLLPDEQLKVAQLEFKVGLKLGFGF
ncbi:MAG: hypothetical protein WDZ35_12245 [Crocinitomicaceae bacterium]